MFERQVVSHCSETHSIIQESKFCPFPYLFNSLQETSSLLHIWRAEFLCCLFCSVSFEKVIQSEGGGEITTNYFHFSLFSDSQMRIAYTAHCSRGWVSLQKQHGNENIWSNGHLGFPNKLNQKIVCVIAESFMGIVRHLFLTRIVLLHH